MFSYKIFCYLFEFPPLCDCKARTKVGIHNNAKFLFLLPNLIHLVGSSAIRVLNRLNYKLSRYSNKLRISCLCLPTLENIEPVMYYCNKYFKHCYCLA